MPAKKIKYYAYFVPTSSAKSISGVTDDWKKCERLVSGKTGARFKSFTTRAEAEKWVATGARYESKTAAREAIRLQPGIYFDAGTGRGEGVEVSVTDEKGKDLLHEIIAKKELNKFGKQNVKNAEATNNYGELLALKYALAIAEKSDGKKIFGDSKLVIEFWSRWKIKRKDVAVETVALADEVSALREAFEKNGGTVERISGDHNPADLGFH